MSNKPTKKGQNPFDKFLTQSEGVPTMGAAPVFEEPVIPETESPHESQNVDRLWERMKQAQEIAERQREYTREALRPKKSDASSLSRSSSSAQLPELPKATWKDYWTGRHLWMWMCTCIWIWFSIGAIRGNLWGGITLSIVFFFPTVIVMRLPQFLGGIGPGRNARSSGSAI